MMAELKQLAEQGQARVAQGKELAEMDSKSKAVFEQFKEDDLNKLSQMLLKLEEENNSNTDRSENRAALRASIGTVRSIA